MQLPIVQLVRTPILVSVYSTSMVPTGTTLLKFSLLVHYRMVTHDLIFIATGLEDFSSAGIQWHGTNVKFNRRTLVSLDIWSHCTACGNCCACKSLCYGQPRGHLIVLWQQEYPARSSDKWQPEMRLNLIYLGF